MNNFMVAQCQVLVNKWRRRIDPHAGQALRILGKFAAQRVAKYPIDCRIVVKSTSLFMRMISVHYGSLHYRLCHLGFILSLADTLSAAGIVFWTVNTVN